jgi:hypothetical protein
MDNDYDLPINKVTKLKPKSFWKYLRITNNIFFSIVYISYFFLVISNLSEVLSKTLNTSLFFILHILVATQGGVLVILFFILKSKDLQKLKVILFFFQIPILVFLLFILISNYIILFFQIENSFIIDWTKEYENISNNTINGLWMISVSVFIFLIPYLAIIFFKKITLNFSETFKKRYGEILLGIAILAGLLLGARIGLPILENESPPPEWIQYILQKVVLNWPIVYFSYILFYKYSDWKRIETLTVWEVISTPASREIRTDEEVEKMEEKSKKRRKKVNKALFEKQE